MLSRVARAIVAASAALVCVSVAASAAQPTRPRAALAQQDATVDWLQWGGPRRNFTSDATGLADSWPDSGPRELWRRDRSFAKASFLRADGKLIVLDEDGVLGLARVTPAGMEVLSRAEVFRSRSWTVPTLSGTVLYARDLQEIAAFDLSAAANPRD